MRRRIAALALALACSTAARSDAQTRTGRWEISGGGLWSGGYDLGSQSANETRNPGTGSGGFSLFQSETTVTPALGATFRLGFRLSDAVTLEAGGHYLRPDVSTDVSGDAEDAAASTLTESLTRIVVDGSLVYHLQGLRFAGGRGVPFLTGGAGYLRELHEGNELIETGSEYSVGAGLKYWLGQGAHRFGARIDVGASIRSGGFDFSDKTRTLPTLGFGVVYLF